MPRTTGLTLRAWQPIKRTYFRGLVRHVSLLVVCDGTESALVTPSTQQDQDIQIPVNTCDLRVYITFADDLRAAATQAALMKKDGNPVPLFLHLTRKHPQKPWQETEHSSGFLTFTQDLAIDLHPDTTASQVWEAAIQVQSSLSQQYGLSPQVETAYQKACFVSGDKPGWLELSIIPPASEELANSLSFCLYGADIARSTPLSEASIACSLKTASRHRFRLQDEFPSLWNLDNVISGYFVLSNVLPDEEAVLDDDSAETPASLFCLGVGAAESHGVDDRLHEFPVWTALRGVDEAALPLASQAPRLAWNDETKMNEPVTCVTLDLSDDQVAWAAYRAAVMNTRRGIEVLRRSQHIPTPGIQATSTTTIHVQFDVVFHDVLAPVFQDAAFKTKYTVFLGDEEDTQAAHQDIQWRVRASHDRVDSTDATTFEIPVGRPWATSLRFFSADGESHVTMRLLMNEDGSSGSCEFTQSNGCDQAFSLETQQRNWFRLMATGDTLLRTSAWRGNIGMQGVNSLPSIEDSSQFLPPTPLTLYPSLPSQQPPLLAFDGPVNAFSWEAHIAMGDDVTILANRGAYTSSRLEPWEYSSQHDAFIQPSLFDNVLAGFAKHESVKVANVLVTCYLGGCTPAPFQQSTAALDLLLVRSPGQPSVLHCIVRKQGWERMDEFQKPEESAGIRVFLDANVMTHVAMRGTRETKPQDVPTASSASPQLPTDASDSVSSVLSRNATPAEKAPPRPIPSSPEKKPDQASGSSSRSTTKKPVRYGLWGSGTIRLIDMFILFATGALSIILIVFLVKKASKSKTKASTTNSYPSRAVPPQNRPFPPPLYRNQYNYRGLPSRQRPFL